MNSFYGVMGTTGCRFYHADLPTAITGTGVPKKGAPEQRKEIPLRENPEGERERNLLSDLHQLRITRQSPNMAVTAFLSTTLRTRGWDKSS